MDTFSEKEIKKIFSKNLTTQLVNHGKTQKDLVDYIKVSSSTVSNWCTGQKLPRMNKIQAIAEWLTINTSDLLETKGTQSNNTIVYTPEVNAAARIMMDLSPEDQKTALEMIQFLSQKNDKIKKNI